MGHTDAICKHYASPTILGRIEEGLGKIGKTPQTVTLDELAPLDEFHTRGMSATVELIDLLDARANMHVLDVGAGLGGSARRLATARGCRVTGVDLSDDYCRAGTTISEWLGLGGRVTLTAGDATDLSRFATDFFDAAWTIHVGMNVAAKAAFYGEIARVVKPGARLVIYDILAGNGGDIHFPVPWARDASTSFLATRDQLTDLIARAGFGGVEFRDQSKEGIAFIEQGLARMKQPGGPPPLGLHLVLGREFGVMAENLLKNLAEDRAALAAVVAKKSA